MKNISRSNTIKIIAVFFSSVLLLSCNNKAVDKQENQSNTTNSKSPVEIKLTDDQIKAIGIEIDKISFRNLKTSLKVNGRLELPPQNRAQVSVLVGGIVIEIPVMEGQFVNKGQALATLENSEFLQTQQEYFSTKANLNFAKSEYERQKELQKDNMVNYLFTLVHFGSNIINTYWQIPISKVESIYIQSDGMTALYQAIGETLDKFPQTDPVLVKIFTDGEENQSRGKYNNASSVKTLIDSLEQKDFTITFVGTASDVESIKRNLSIAAGNTLVHDNTEESVKMSFRKSMDATVSYSANVAKGNFTKTLNFYND